MKESKELTSAPNVSIMDEEKVLGCNCKLNTVGFVQFFAVARFQPSDRYYAASRRSMLVIEATGGLIIIITRLEPSDCDTGKRWDLCDSPLERGVGVCSLQVITHPCSRTSIRAPSQEGN